MNTYAVGNLIRLSATFRTSLGTLIDPAVVKVSVRDPAGVITTYTYGIDGGVIRAGQGSYFYDADALTTGDWRYRWFATGSGQSAGEGSFKVHDSPFMAVEA